MKLKERWSKRGQSGFTSMEVLLATSGSAALAGLIMMTTGDQVGAAEGSACLTEREVISTALDAYLLTEGSMNYPFPAGVDGLDALRDENLLRKQSQYWHYDGVDMSDRVLLSPTNPEADCS